MRVCTKIQVRYGETDMMGIVYHGNYALYLEDARTEFLEKIGCPYKEIEDAGFMSPVVELDVRYGRPLKYGDTVIVRTRVVENKASRTVYAYEIFREGMDLENDAPLSTAKSVHCVVDSETFKPVNIKRSLPELFERYEQVKEE